MTLLIQCKPVAWLLLMLLLFGMVDARAPEIVQSFTNVTLALGQNPEIQTCVIIGDAIFIRVNGTLENHSNRGTFANRGIIFTNENSYLNGTSDQSVTVAATKMNNNTRLQCIAVSMEGSGPPAFSENATIYIAGPPLSPYLQYLQLNGSTLQIYWNEPFTVGGFPIMGYILTITSSNGNETHTIAGRSFSLSLSRDNINITVEARNAVGNSAPGVLPLIELGLIYESPETAVVPLGSNISFSCAAEGYVSWEINGTQATTSSRVAELSATNVYVPLSMLSHSAVVVTATVENNGSSLVCIVEREQGEMEIRRSNAAQLIAYGEPSPPSNLTVTVLGRDLGVVLNWMQGFALMGEEVTFVIIAEEASLGLQSRVHTNLTTTTLFTFPNRGRCQRYSYTVFSENGFSRSNSAISQNVTLPAVPVPLETVNTTVVFSQDVHSANVLFEFNDSSPCIEFSVNNYTLTFVETANSNEEPLSAVFSASYPATGEERVSIMLSRSDGVLPGRQYNFTLLATNIEGSSAYSAILYTTGLQSVQIVSDLLTVSITCVFATGRITSKGCHVAFGVALQFNISREVQSHVATRLVHLPEDLRDRVSLEMVTVAEILADGRISSISFSPDIAITSATTQVIPTISAASGITECTFFTAFNVLIGLLQN